MNIQWVGSPNYTSGRTQPITKIVIHWMDGTLASTDAQFSNPNSQVSAHYGIENDNVHQYVQDGDTAWHAITANPYSIGIEHSAEPGRPASDATINTSAQLVAQLCSKHNIQINSGSIIPHSQVVETECPGTIPIDTIISKAQTLTKGDDMIKNEDEADLLYRAIAHEAPSADWLKGAVGQPWTVVAGKLYQSNKWNQDNDAITLYPGMVNAKAALIKEVQSLDGGQVDKNKVLNYINKNLK